MNRLNKVFRIAGALLIGMLATQATAYAQIGPDPDTMGRASKIVGLWDVEAAITRCDTGDALFTFPALHKYERGGTGQVVPATNPAGLSAHMVVWNFAGGKDFQTAMKMFQFDATGIPIGWVVVTSEVSINEDADEYVGSGVAEFFDMNGDPTGVVTCPVFTGTRFTGET
jgi:hypothetical protein